MRKVVINNMHGGFRLSDQAKELYCSLKGLNLKKINGVYYINDEANEFDEYDIKRDDPYLVKTVETLQNKANGFLCELKIVEIPVDLKFVIEDYDGLESIVEFRRKRI